MKYKRSKTDSVLYCPYCGRTFRMTTERYFASYRARDNGSGYALTKCNTCGKPFYFKNLTPESVRSGARAILKLEEVNKCIESQL